MWKKIAEWFKKTFTPPEKVIPKPIEPEAPVLEPVAIRPDARQGWQHLIECLAASNLFPFSMKRAMLAQWIIESGRGTSALAKDHCNYAGIKFRKELEGLAVPVDYKASDGMDTYAKFEGDVAFIEGYLRFINRPIYKGWEAQMDNSLRYIEFLKSKGYAGDPDYVKKVSAVFGEAESLLLNGVHISPGANPGDSTPFNHEDHVYEEPKIEIVDIPTIIPHGKYSTPSGRAKGVVQHYTAGHVSPGAAGVIQMLKTLGTREGRLGCFGMDEKGVLYVPKQLGWTQKGYHAGSSLWKGVSGMNSYLMGIEVCNPGKLVAAGGEWFPYFYVKNGKAVAGAKAVDPKRCRTWTSPYGKQAKGTYMAFTEAQEKALINFSLWQRRVNPEYNLDWVVGHDEISLSGKTDPGACLSMPMTQWRDLLKRLAVK